MYENTFQGEDHENILHTLSEIYEGKGKWVSRKPDTKNCNSILFNKSRILTVTKTNAKVTDKKNKTFF